MIKYFCDKCGEQVRSHYILTFEYLESSKSHILRKELCLKCQKKIILFADSKEIEK